MKRASKWPNLTVQFSITFLENHRWIPIYLHKLPIDVQNQWFWFMNIHDLRNWDQRPSFSRKDLYHLFFQEFNLANNQKFKSKIIKVEQMSPRNIKCIIDSYSCCVTSQREFSFTAFIWLGKGNFKFNDDLRGRLQKVVHFCKIFIRSFNFKPTTTERLLIWTKNSKIVITYVTQCIRSHTVCDMTYETYSWAKW